VGAPFAVIIKVMRALLFLLLLLILSNFRAGALTLTQAKLFESALKSGACSLEYFKELSNSEVKEPFLIAFVEDCYKLKDYELLSKAREVKNPLSKLKVAQALRKLGREKEAREIFKEVFSSTNDYDEEVLLLNRGNSSYLFTPKVLRKKVWIAARNRRIDEALYYLSYLKKDPYYAYLLAYTYMRSGKRRLAKELFLKTTFPKRYYYLIFLSSSPVERLEFYKKFLFQNLPLRLKRRVAVYALDYYFRKDLGLFRKALKATYRPGLKDIYYYFRDRYRFFTKGCTRKVARHREPQKWWLSACGLSSELPAGINFYSLILNPPEKFPYDREKVFSTYKLTDEGLKYLYDKGFCSVLTLITVKTPQTALLMSLCGEYKKGIKFALPYRNELSAYPYLLAVLYPKPPLFGDDLISLAIARQESLFDERALSRSGARGLMQIMPATGRYIAKKLKEENYSTLRLYEPELNYRFGSYYIHSLLKQFKLFPLAAAAYNGGPGRVKRALKLYGKIEKPGDVIIFNDVYIPFNETRDYVRRTAVNLYYYSNLYGKGDEWRTFLRP